MAKNFILEQLKKEFKGKPFFTRESLLAFYRQFDPDLNESTFRWSLYYLKSKGIITPIDIILNPSLKKVDLEAYIVKIVDSSNFIHMEHNRAKQ